MAPTTRFRKSYVCPALFLKENGEPCQFYLHKSIKDKLFFDLIERGGGTVCKRLNDLDDIIKLAKTSQGSLSKDFISTDFIMDSVKQEVAQDLTKYRLNREFKPRFTHTVNYKDEERNESNETSFRSKRRRKYTYQDDMKIIKYVKENSTEDMPFGGNVLWKQMQKEKVTDHSWQSMQKHFKVFLQDKIDQTIQNIQASLTLSRLEKPTGHSTPTKTKAKPATPKRKSAERVTSPTKKSKAAESSSCLRDKPQKRKHPKELASPSKSESRNTDKKSKPADADSDDSSVDDFDQHLIKIARERTNKMDSDDDDDDDDDVDKDEDYDNDDHQIDDGSVDDDDEEEEEEEEGKKDDDDDDDDTQDTDPNDHETSAKDTQDDEEGCVLSLRSRNLHRSPHRKRQPLSPSSSKSPSVRKPSTRIQNTSQTTERRNLGSTLTPNSLSSPEKKRLWDAVDKQFMELAKFMELPCAQELTVAQVLRVFYVTSGSVDEGRHYIETGKLSNGDSPWSKEEDDIIKSNNHDGLKSLFTKRGRNNVVQRKRFLNS